MKGIGSDIRYSHIGVGKMAELRSQRKESELVFRSVLGLWNFRIGLGVEGKGVVPDLMLRLRPPLLFCLGFRFEFSRRSDGRNPLRIRIGTTKGRQQASRSRGTNWSSRGSSLSSICHFHITSGLGIRLIRSSERDRYFQSFNERDELSQNAMVKINCVRNYRSWLESS